MKEGESWVVLDTETTGIRNPVYPIEIAAQMMQGWNPVGPPARVLVNFDVPIEPIAEKMYGYSREYLRRFGMKPAEAMSTVLEYVGSSPVVSYNLAYDWNRVLAPTVQRMRLKCRLQVGFCALKLARNVVQGVRDFKLSTLIKAFQLAEKQVHHAEDDVCAVVRFLAEYLGPHFQDSQIIGFEYVAQCAEGKRLVPPLQVPESKKPVPEQAGLSAEDMFAIGELVGICRAISFDGRISDDELNFLAQWLERCPNTSAEPIARMHRTVGDIVEDGVVTTDELARRSKEIDEVVGWRP